MSLRQGLRVLPPPDPKVPQNVSVNSDLSKNRLVVTWNTVVGATGYQVFRGLSQDTSQMRLASITETLVLGEQLVRGPTGGPVDIGADALLASDVWKVLRISLNPPGSITNTGGDFLNGVDYVLIGNKIDWRLRNRQPVSGQPYFVDYTRRDPLTLTSPVFIDQHADKRLEPSTAYWYSVVALFADGSRSSFSVPVRMVFKASDVATRTGDKTLGRL